MFFSAYYPIQVSAADGFDDPITLDNSNGKPTIAIGSDGFPGIAFDVHFDPMFGGDFDAFHSNFIHCTSIDCSTFDAPRTLTTVVAAVQVDLTMEIGTDGFPVMVFEQEPGTSFDDPWETIQLIHCTSVDCSTFDAPMEIILTDERFLIGGLDMTVGTDGFPVVIFGFENTGVNFIHCTSVDCSTSDAPVILDSVVSADGNFETSIVIGSDNNPVISYSGGDVSGRDLNLIHCTSVDCSTSDAPVILDNSHTGAADISMEIGTDDFPVIIYRGNNDDINFIHCTSVNCSTSDAPVILDSGRDGVMTIGEDNNPMIIYDFNSNLQLIHCTSVDCSTSDAPVILDSDGANPSVAIGTDDNPAISYSGSLEFIHCTTPTCTVPDTETFCDNKTIPELISSGTYNVIDNRDGSLGGVIFGTDSRDLILASDGGDKVLGDGGADCIIGGDGPDNLIGGNGDDKIFSQGGIDKLFGQNGKDRLFGGDDRDIISGGAHNDRIFGDDGNDVLNGGNGNDTILGNNGNDKLFGDAGKNDNLIGGSGTDTLDGGIGDNDRCNTDGNDNPPIGCEIIV